MKKPLSGSYTVVFPVKEILILFYALGGNGGHYAGKERGGGLQGVFPGRRLLFPLYHNIV
jgi:hypothetical protein